MRLETAVTVLVLLLALFALPASAGEEEILRLAEGRKVQGGIVKETPDRVFVDLGWTILGVPRDEIVAREVVGREEKPTSGSTQAEGALYYTSPGLRERPVREVVGQVADAVVMISTPHKGGSGFVISPDGYLLTNAHVVQGETKITVTLFKTVAGSLEKRKVENVHLVAQNAYADLALLKIDGEEPLPYVFLAAEDGCRVGHTDFAIGNPLGLERSVSEGIVSTMNRAFEGLTYIQTTVQINPGNSGGPLFNLKGEVIGVTNMGMLFAEGLNFAIPVERVRWFLANRQAFAFDKDNPNTGYTYLEPPKKIPSAPSPEPSEPVATGESQD